MPLPILERVGRQVSTVLHHLVFSFPSPNITDQTLSAPTPVPGGAGSQLDSLQGKHSAHEEYGGFLDVDEPGAPRAFAGGVGPLSFAGSGYGVTLVLVGILLNRIHHIVRRPRQPPQPLPHPPINSLYHRVKQSDELVAFVVSRALVSPSTPKYLRLPGLICLVRAWILFSILTLQVAKLWPIDSPLLLALPFGASLSNLGHWAGGMPMDQVCWQVFLSVCAGLLCSGFANGLDRARRRDTGASFNLFGYSFLLHLYSSPLTHHRPPPAASHGRPDVHALFQLWLSLTELTWLQAVETTSSHNRNQLLPTAVCGTLGLGHFVYALMTSPLKFPSFTFLTHLMALFLSIIIISSMVVKAMTYIFTLGYLPSPIFRNLLPHEGVVPSPEDDFGIMLLKVGTACLEATQYAGLQNEMIPIPERPGPYVELSTGRSEVVKPVRLMNGYSAGGFGTEIIDIDVAEAETTGRTERRWYTAWKAFWHAFGTSVTLFAWSILISTPWGRRMVKWSQKMWIKRWWYGPRQWQFWRRQAWQEPQHLRYRRVTRIMEEFRERQRQLNLAAAEAARDAERSSTGTSTALQLREASPTPAPLPWRQHLLGQETIEDDEDDWEDDASSTSSVSLASSAGDIGEDLFRDMVSSTNEGPSEDVQAVLLAHLTNSSTPLTRRRYAAIMSGAQGSSSALTISRLDDIIADRRAVATAREAQGDDWDDDRRRSCVVCTVEPRNTILWPCRCLALCNDCRESLATRLPAKDHLCPCCRKKVEGFSRIYVP